MSPVQEKSPLVFLRLLGGVHPATRSVKSTHADNALEGVRQNIDVAHGVATNRDFDVVNVF